MKIKKYITAVILAMSLTTGLVFANADEKQKTTNLTETKKAEEIKPFIVGYKFKGKDMPKNPQKAFLSATKEKPYKYEHKANTPEVSLFLYIIFNEFFEKNNLDKSALIPMLSDTLYSGILDKNGNIKSKFSNLGYCIYDNFKKPEEMKRFKETFEKEDFSKIKITKGNFESAKKEVVKLIREKIEQTTNTLETNKQILRLLKDNKKEKAIKFAEKSIKKSYEKYNPKLAKEWGAEKFKQIAKDVCASPDSLEGSIKFLETNKKVLPGKISLIDKLKYNDVKALENIFQMEKTVMEVPIFTGK